MLKVEHGLKIRRTVCFKLFMAVDKRLFSFKSVYHVITLTMLLTERYI